MKYESKKSIIIGWIFVVGVLIMYVRVMIFGDFHPVHAQSIAQINSIPLADKLIIVYGLGSYVILWFWMLIDFFKARPKQFPVLWGLGLIFLSQVAVLAYFYIIFRGSRKNPELT
jgi:hypothetical protein